MRKRKKSLNEISVLSLLVVLLLFLVPFIYVDAALLSLILISAIGFNLLFKIVSTRIASKRMKLPGDSRKMRKNLVEVHVGKKAKGSVFKFRRIVFETCTKAFDKNCDVVMYFWKFPPTFYQVLFNGEAEVEMASGFEGFSQIIFNVHYWRDRKNNKKEGQATLPLLKITLRHGDVSQQLKDKLKR